MTRIMINTKLLTLLAALLITAGCQTGVRPPVVGRQDPYQPQQMHFATDELRRDTAVQEPVVDRDENGLLRVTIPIRSAIDKTLYVDYRVSFFDRNGQPLGEHVGWFTKTLEANTPDRITVTSVTPRAADFQVDFRYSR